MVIRIVRLGVSPRQMDVAIPNCYRDSDPFVIKEYVMARWPGWRFDRVVAY